MPSVPCSRHWLIADKQQILVYKYKVKRLDFLEIEAFSMFTPGIVVVLACGYDCEHRRHHAYLSSVTVDLYRRKG